MWLGDLSCLALNRENETLTALTMIFETETQRFREARRALLLAVAHATGYRWFQRTRAEPSIVSPSIPEMHD